MTSEWHNEEALRVTKSRSIRFECHKQRKEAVLELDSTLLDRRFTERQRHCFVAERPSRPPECKRKSSTVFVLLQPSGSTNRIHSPRVYHHIYVVNITVSQRASRKSLWNRLSSDNHQLSLTGERYLLGVSPNNASCYCHVQISI